MIKTLLQIYGILRWHKQTFPSFTYHEQQEKLAAEIREYEDALESYIKRPNRRRNAHLSEELADIVIAATNLYRYPEMRKLIRDKMKINRTRTWQKGQHND